jgi:hypothetical protein
MSAVTLHFDGNLFTTDRGINVFVTLQRTGDKNERSVFITPEQPSCEMHHGYTKEMLEFF